MKQVIQPDLKFHFEKNKFQEKRKKNSAKLQKQFDSQKCAKTVKSYLFSISFSITELIVSIYINPVKKSLQI